MDALFLLLKFLYVIFKSLFLLLLVSFCACAQTHMCVLVPEKVSASNPLRMVVTHLGWELGTELTASERPANAVNH